MPKNVKFHNCDIKFSDNKYHAEYQGKKWESSDGINWSESLTESEKTLQDYFNCRSSNLTESQKKIVEVCDSMKDLLLYKNQKYGDSALNPNNIFYKGDSTNSIKIRLDDKIGRIKNCEETRINDVCDIIGYCTLLLVSMDVSKNEINLLKD